VLVVIAVLVATVYVTRWRSMDGKTTLDDVCGVYRVGGDELRLLPDATYTFNAGPMFNDPRKFAERGTWQIQAEDGCGTAVIYLSPDQRIGNGRLSLVERQGQAVRPERSLLGVRLSLGWDSDSRWYMERTGR
jgi:hypothetical protein